MTTSTRPRHSQLRLLFLFALASLVPIVGLGYWLVGELRQSGEHQALRAYQHLSMSFLDPMVTPTNGEPMDLDHLGDADRRALDEGVTAVSSLLRVRFISTIGHITYSTERGEIGTDLPGAWANDLVMGGTGRRFVAADRVAYTEGSGRVFQYALPLRLAGQDQDWGVIEVTGPTALLADATPAVRDTEALFLTTGLSLLWLLMLPIFWWVSLKLKRQVDENERLAQHDALTGLPNRTLLASRLTDALTESVQQHSVVGHMLIDLDDFKDVNDTLGHHAGDVLLQHVADRISSAVRPGDTVSRLGGDEFAVVVANAQHPSVISGVAERLLDSLERPVQIGEVLVTPGASIGIALAPDHGTTVDVLMQRADIAMYAAKAGGLGRRTYSQTIDSHSPSRLGLTSELRTALRSEDQIDLVYQPIVDSRTGEVVQLETLVRWKHPQRGELLPKDFLEMAERSGLVAQLTERTLAVALRQLRTWLDAGLTVRLGVNLSSVVLRDQTLPSQISTQLNHLRVPASLLEFEVTETSLLEEPESVLVLLRQLRALGASVALDDFGSGFSSLVHLRSLEADVVKIDRQFVEHILTRSADAKIVGAVIDLAHELGMTVTGEGVETEGQAVKLAAMGCDRLQGYYLARPLPAYAATALLRERSRLAAANAAAAAAAMSASAGAGAA